MIVVSGENLDIKTDRRTGITVNSLVCDPEEHGRIKSTTTELLDAATFEPLSPACTREDVDLSAPTDKEEATILETDNIAGAKILSLAPGVTEGATTPESVWITELPLTDTGVLTSIKQGDEFIFIGGIVIFDDFLRFGED